MSPLVPTCVDKLVTLVPAIRLCLIACHGFLHRRSHIRNFVADEPPALVREARLARHERSGDPAPVGAARTARADENLGPDPLEGGAGGPRVLQPAALARVGVGAGGQALRLSRARCQVVFSTAIIVY